MTALLAIDPGACTGWAFFGNGELFDCGVTEIDAKPCRAVEILQVNYSPKLLVIEQPEIYNDRSVWKGDPNDLIKVALQVGRWIERATLAGATVKTTLPKTWKGQTPKAIHNARALGKLSVLEANRVPRMADSKRHNMIDAIALGLWTLGRLPRSGR